MIQKLLARNEGKTLEFKENAESLNGIIKTVIAFANTAGGIIVIGVEDKGAIKKIGTALRDPRGRYILTQNFNHDLDGN